MDFDLSTAVLALHVLVGTVFVGLGVQNFVNGRQIGLVLNGLLGLLIVGMGVGVSRLVD
ncbi:hypothetical protein SAMN05216388_100247 [Halorientalis persicus]|jgi:hypothetical protein|uniref:Uncharacterized protein n=1 Tax=Halorientalis persicus TaxID=1367881 RepID=A0A1H8ELN1_9EURY|nr:hypothetical protein [Halorientalis persicus]SEN20372.1 hypothetical protein SAMN05216388_100247 [Halorientalis persicus]